jgi:hypothetical protein
MQSSGGLTDRDIYIIIEKFIGAPGGDLLGFSFKTLHQFLTFDLQIPEDVYKDGGTKRKQLELALKNSDPYLQTKILRELLIRFPVDETIPVFFPTLSPRERARQDVEHILAKLEPTVVRNNRITASQAGSLADHPHSMQDNAPLDNDSPNSENSQP